MKDCKDILKKIVLALKALKAYSRNYHLSYPSSFNDCLRVIRSICMVAKHTPVTIPRLVVLHKLTKEIDSLVLPGDVIECGVYNGGSAYVIASTCFDSPMNRNIWLFDSFEGLPKPTNKDGAVVSMNPEGWFIGNETRVKEFLQKAGMPESRVHIIKGWFQNTFPSVQIRDIALLHIDVDLYESVKMCLEKFYDSVRPGGFVVIDDYGGGWEGCKAAVDWFLEARFLEVDLIHTDIVGCYFQKPLRLSA